MLHVFFTSARSWVLMEKTLQPHKFTQQIHGLKPLPGSVLPGNSTPSSIALNDSNFLHFLQNSYSIPLPSANKNSLLLYWEKERKALFLTFRFLNFLCKYVSNHACPYHQYAHHDKGPSPFTVIIFKILCFSENPPILADGIHLNSYYQLQLDLDGYPQTLGSA